MRETFPGSHFGLSDPDILQKLRSIEQGFVLTSINKNSGGSAMLCQDDGTFGVTDLPNDGGQIRAEVSKGTNVLSRSDACHQSGSSKMYDITYI